MSTKTITIHADELEYTSEGLRPTGQIELTAGFHHKIVIERPSARPAIPVGAGGFEVDSSFPTPVVLAALIGPSLDRLFRRESPPVYQVFGHASPDGNIDHNKDVADRRARMFVSLLVGEVKTAQSIAADEQWGATEQQVMLRALHCDPGLIDGEHGPLTEKSVRDFQTDYNDGVFTRTPASRRLLHPWLSMARWTPKPSKPWSSPTLLPSHRALGPNSFTPRTLRLDVASSISSIPMLELETVGWPWSSTMSYRNFTTERPVRTVMPARVPWTAKVHGVVFGTEATSLTLRRTLHDLISICGGSRCPRARSCFLR